MLTVLEVLQKYVVRSFAAVTAQMMISVLRYMLLESAGKALSLPRGTSPTPQRLVSTL